MAASMPAQLPTHFLEWQRVMQMPQVPPSDPLARFLAGGLAGAVSRTVTAPLERMRTMVIDLPAFQPRHDHAVFSLQPCAG